MRKEEGQGGHLHQRNAKMKFQWLIVGLVKGQTALLLRGSSPERWREGLEDAYHSDPVELGLQRCKGWIIQGPDGQGEDWRFCHVGKKMSLKVFRSVGVRTLLRVVMEGFVTWILSVIFSASSYLDDMSRNLMPHRVIPAHTVFSFFEFHQDQILKIHSLEKACYLPCETFSHWHYLLTSLIPVQGQNIQNLKEL